MARDMSETTIAGLARAGGVGVETVRYYQRRGLLSTPERPDGGGLGGGVRRYGDAEIRRLRFIRQAQGAGFTLEEIRELIALDATDDRPRARALAAGRIAALDTRIAELQASRDALHRLAHACAAPSPGPCPILTAFEAE
jgi:MerR family mercuric resistance operon transcriptional regulator